MAADSDTFAEWASQPFAPTYLQNNGATAEVGERIALSLEYIAAQLGEISRKMDHLDLTRGTTRADFERMNQLLKRL